MPSGIRISAKSALVLLLVCALCGGILPQGVRAQRTSPPAEPALTITPYLLDNQDQQPVVAEWVRLVDEENRMTGSDSAVEIPFLRYRTRAAEPGPPLVILTDSPLNRTSPLSSTDQFLALTALFGGSSDIILMEPRGVGEARPRLDCPGRFDLSLDRPALYDRLARVLGAYYALCSDLWQGAGVDLAAYNAREMAGDVEAMRRALGYDKIGLIGVGFGSHVALTLLKESPESIDRAAMMLILGPDQMLTLPADVQQQLVRLDGRVKADPTLAQQMPDFLGTVATVLDRLTTAPVSVTIEDPLDGSPIDVTVGQLDLQYATAITLAGTEQRSLPARYAEMALGDYTWLAEAALTWRRNLGGSLMPAVAQCASNASAERLAQIDEESETTLLGNAINGVWFDTCSSMGDVVLDDEFREAVTSDVPVLLVNGNMDALTPDGNGEAVLAGLSNGQLLIVDGASHDLIDEALPQLAPVLIEFMLGDTTADFSGADLAVPFVLEPIGVQPVAEVTGWLAEFYNNLDLSGAPVLTRDDATIDFNWGDAAPAPEVTPDNFSARWTITRTLPADIYRLTVSVDGGVRVWINDVPVLDGWEDRGPRSYVVDLNLGRGEHTARVEYVSGTGDAAISVNFTRVQRFPDWKAEYFANPDLAGEPAVVRNEEQLDYFWGQNPPVPGIPANDWSGRWSRRAAFEATAYRFSIDVAGGVRLWLDGQLLVDSWGDQGPRQLAVDSSILTAGEHDLRVDYFKRSGDGRLRVAWQPIAGSSPPKAVLRGPTRAQVGQSIVLDGSGSSAAAGREIVEYRWEWGDGTSSSGVQAEHAYGTAGIYTVSLTVTDDSGASGTTSVQIRIDNEPTAPDPGQPPIAVINAPRQGAVGQPVVFDALDSASSNPIISFGWQFGDGTTADAVSVAKIYTTPGTYNVTLTVTDDQGLQSTANRLILIGAAAPTPTPGAPLAPTPTPVVPTPIPPTPTPTSVITETLPIEPTAPPVPEVTPIVTPTVTPTVTPVTGESPLDQPTGGTPPTAVIQATVNGAPVQTLGTEGDSTLVQVQANQEIVFNAGGSSTGSTPLADNGYRWQVAQQEFVDQVVTFVFPGTGRYTVQLTVTNQANQSDTVTWLVQVP